MDSQNRKIKTPTFPPLFHPTVPTFNVMPGAGLMSSTLSQKKPSATNQLNFKQSKPVAPHHPKHTCSPRDVPLGLSKKSEVAASSPLLTYQKAQKYLQPPTTPQLADQSGTMRQYLVHPQGSMMNNKLPNAINIPSNSMCSVFIVVFSF